MINVEDHAAHCRMVAREIIITDKGAFLDVVRMAWANGHERATYGRSPSRKKLR